MMDVISSTAKLRVAEPLDTGGATDEAHSQVESANIDKLEYLQADGADAAADTPIATQDGDGTERKAKGDTVATKL